MATIPSTPLSDALQEAIGSRRVAAALFTTFSFDPGFFENEVLPILFNDVFSHAEKVRRVQLESALQDLDEVVVYFDRKGLVSGGQPATLDVRRVPVTRSTGYFHPKLILLMLEHDVASEDGSVEIEESLLVGVLSANLTRSGWWENVECACFEELRLNEQNSIAADLKKLLAEVQKSDRHGSEGPALKRIKSFLRRVPRSKTRTSKGRLRPHLYWGQETFPEYLADILKLPRDTYRLDVLSPYFDKAEEPQALWDLAYAVEPLRIRLFLPEDEDGAGRCHQAFFESVDDLQWMEWGRLPAEHLRLGRSASEETAKRFVHAKVYRFFNADEGREIIVVGSVNLTRAAFAKGKAGNLEAALVVEVDPEQAPKSWLTRVKEPPVGGFQASPVGEPEEDAAEPPPLSVRYDWERGEATYFMEAGGAPEGVRMQLAHAGSLIADVDAIAVDRWVPLDEAASKRLEALLRSTSFLEVTVDDRLPATILVEETGMASKPSLLLTLTAEEILRYWSLLSAEQRASFLEAKAYQLLVQEGLAPPKESYSTATDGLFDQFASIFHAFGQLREHVFKALDEEREGQAVYRLFGQKWDSLPVLVDYVLNDDEGDAVRRYVTLLTAQQLLRATEETYPDFVAAHRDAASALKARLEDIDQLRAQLDVGEDADAFLAWFERRFLKEEAPKEVA